MKEKDNIPVSKVQRTTGFLKAGAKVGRNYLSHYTKKAFGGKADKSDLNSRNAEDIYASLAELKGTALKVAQVASMDKNILPQEFTKKFMEAQYQAPPLSAPLVRRTFKKVSGKNPEDIFDSFSPESVHAASIGQVHKAALNNKELAVKIQYPGVAESVESDLQVIKPIAYRIFGIKGKQAEDFFEEVKNRMLEETDYLQEMKQGIELGNFCKHLPGMEFPSYYKDVSSSKILVMDWMNGKPLKLILDEVENLPQITRNSIGQRLWDFFEFQIHVLKKFHADPHPGNFLIKDDFTIQVIDFGCVKNISEEFYTNFFSLLKDDVMHDDHVFDYYAYKLQMLYEEDTPKELFFFRNSLKEAIRILSKPFKTEHFDFGEDSFLDELSDFGLRMSKTPEVYKNKRARGPADALYVNRTYFGLFTILSKLKANIKTENKWVKEINTQYG